MRRERAARQLLVTPARDAGAVVRALLAIQAQDPRAARLAVRARSDAAAAASLDARLGPGGDLVAGWLLRGTLHLVAREDYPWLLGLTGPSRMTTSARRLAQLGVSPGAADRAVVVAERALAVDGPLGRGELARRMGSEGQATPHLLMLAALRGRIVSAGETFALASDWLGAEPAPALAGEARELALGELARRYLAAHAPASDADLAHWSGLPLRDARAGLAMVARTPRAHGGGRVPPRLLGAFDPYLLGWRSRAFAVAPAHARTVHPGGGMVRAVATDDGLAVGTWTAPGARVAIEPFAPLAPAVAAALARDAADVERLLAA
ncbi:MAG: DNA glycosylase AlkZ-like family protein [Solirubrobacteraceae bacterium]